MAKKRRKKAKAGKPTAKKSKTRRGGKRWSARVTRESDALTLEEGVFTRRSAKAIAQSLKRSADRSRRRKSGAYRSAMSMLTFYINRGGRLLSKTHKARLEKAKDELRALYGKD
ncbi:MAG: DUF3175 domain-containing protein [Pseudolabrys sp.]